MSHEVTADPRSGRIKAPGAIAAAAAYCLWGLFPLYFHSLDPASPWEILAWRITLSFVLVTIYLRLRGEHSWVRPLLADRRRLLTIVAAGVFLAINWVVYIAAVTADRVLDASLGYFINPIFMVLVGVIVLKERLRLVQWIAVALGAAAVLVLSIAYGEVPWIALTLASSFSAYTYLKKTVKLETVQSLAAETIALVPFATVGLAISAFNGHIAMGNHGIGLSARLVGLGVVTAVPLLLFGVATNRIPLSVMGLLQYCTPVVQFALGIFVFHEAVPTARWVGFGLIWCGLILLTIEALVNARSSALANPDL